MKTTLKKGILSSSYRQDMKAVSNPTAQFGILLQPTENEQRQYNILIYIAKEGYKKFGHYSIGVDLLLSGGLRISELISEPTIFVTTTHQIIIKGRKGSNDKIITPLYNVDYWQNYQGWVHNPCYIVSRFSWYRFLKNQGIQLYEKGKKNASVTHVPRKLKAHELYTNNINESTIQNVIGHKNVNSTKYYKPK